MKLVFVGERPTDGSALALPEGWPAEDHEEPDAATAKAKVASKLYKREGRQAAREGDA